VAKAHVDFIDLPGTAKEAAEKLRTNCKRVKFGGCKTINSPLRIVPRAFWRDPFFVLFEKASFSAACLAMPFQIVVRTEFSRSLLSHLHLPAAFFGCRSGANSLLH
jgi:hypothetical protein